MPARRFGSARSAFEMVPRTISFAQGANRALPCYLLFGAPAGAFAREDG